VFAEFPNHQGDVGSHFFMTFPAWLNIAFNQVVIPQNDFNVFFPADFVEPLDPVPVVDIDNDHTVDIIDRNVVRFKQI